jgi:hypothetical protein
MNYTSFGRMKSWLSGAAESVDDAALRKMGNKIRNLLYSAYKRLQIGVDVEECIEVQEFCEPCSDCNCPTYLGISLPPEIMTVEGMWLDGHPIHTYTRWREWQEGAGECKGRKLTGDYMGVSNPTELDPCCGTCPRIAFQALDPNDEGKSVIIHYIDQSDNRVTNEIKLRFSEYVATENGVKRIIAPGGITLPPNLSGGVYVAEAESLRILSEYRPWEIKPAYRRLRLRGICKGDRVLVRGARRFVELYHDWETVEVNNEAGVIQAGLSVRFMESLDKDPATLAKAGAHWEAAMRMFDGDASREIGRTTIRKFNHSPHKIRRSGLNSNSGWRSSRPSRPY